MIEEYPICEYCGKEIRRKSHKKNGKVRWCNMECRRKAQDFKTRAITTCQFCGNTFLEKRDQTNLFCSKKCACSAYRQREAFWKKEDEKEWSAYSEKEQKHRQDLLEQYRELIRQAEQIRVRLERERPCKECGKVFLGSTKSDRYCSLECRKRYENRDRSKRIFRNGKPDLSITLTKVYKRYNGICQICGKKISFDCDSNCNDYPSIDHITPIAKGGLHQWNNVQLACRGCNSAKGANIYPPGQ